MPARTVEQLQTLLGTGAYSYYDPSGSFVAALGQVLPRIYAMGLWRDMCFEVSLSGAMGYVSLPPDTDTVLACTINDYPKPVRSMWHDVRITGRQATLSTGFGIVDAGYYPVLQDMAEVQGTTTDAIVPPTLLYGFAQGTQNQLSTGFNGEITIETDLSASGATQILDQTTAPDLQFAGAAFTQIRSIRYDNVEVGVDIVDPAFPDSVIATIPVGTGVLRFRRFRTSKKDPKTVVHLLVKRTPPTELTPETVIHLANIGAIKMGLLAVLAEDNSDLDRADRHWKKCGDLLDEELRSITGAAKPSLNFDLSGGGSAPPIRNFY